MTEEAFKWEAKEAGYTDEEIQDLLDFQKKSGLPFEAIPLVTRYID